MRILNISQNYHIRGGSDTYYFLLEQLLSDHGHDVVPFAARHTENRTSPWAAFFPEAADFEKPGPRDIARFLYSWPARKQLEALLDSERIDLAHLHIYYGKLTASILAPLRRRGIPIVQTLHEYKLVCPVSTLSVNGQLCNRCQQRRFWNAVRLRCNRGSLARSMLSAGETTLSNLLGSSRLVDRFICVSDFQRTKIRDMGIPADKLTTVHNIIAKRDHAPASGTGEHLLYFGRLERVKGLFTLLDAVAELPNLPVLIAGSGTAEPELRQEIAKRNLGHVRLIGFQSGTALQDLIRRAICTVIPSTWYESFGLTILETFAHGRPVIGSRIGGIPEVIIDGKDGFLVEPGDVKELRDRIELLHRDSDLAEKMGKAGWHKLKTRFSPQVHYDEIMAVYGSVLRH